MCVLFYFIFLGELTSRRAGCDVGYPALAQLVQRGTPILIPLHCLTPHYTSSTVTLCHRPMVTSPYKLL